MTEKEEKAVAFMMMLHVTAHRMLSGCKTLSTDEINFVRDYVREHGLEGIFKTPEEAYPDSCADALLNEAFKWDEDDDSVTVLDDDCFDEDGFCFDEDRITMMLDAGQYVKVDEYAFGRYFMRKLEKVESVDDLNPVLEKCLSLEPVYKDCPDETLPNNLAYFIGDLYFVMGRYDEALERYTQVYEAYKCAETSWKDRCLIEIFNTYYMAKRQPPSDVMIRCGWEAGHSDDLIDKCGAYLARRFSVECAKHGNDFFAWAMSQGNNWAHYTHGVFDCMSSMHAVKVRKRLGLKPLLYFPMMKAVADFANAAYGEAKMIARMQTEFKDNDFLVGKWCEKLEWLETVYREMPDEKIVFAYHTPWTWKFCFDMYFPNRQLVIMFHSPDDFDESEFRHGSAGKIQFLKEWNRVVSKANKTYGMQIAYVPVTHDKSNIGQLVVACASGSYSI